MSNRSAAESKLVEQAIGKRFCLDHQRDVSARDGSMVTRNGKTRWICFQCQLNKGIIKSIPERK